MSLIKKVRSDIKKNEKKISVALDDSKIKITEKKKWLTKEEREEQKKERRELTRKGKENQEITDCINTIIDSIINDIIEEKEKSELKVQYKRPRMRTRKINIIH